MRELDQSRRNADRMRIREETANSDEENVEDVYFAEDAVEHVS